MSFERLLLWIVNWLAGVVTSWLQETFDLAIPGQIVAIALAIIATSAVYALAFLAGIPLFEDAATPEALLEILLAVLVALGGSQTRFAISKKYESNKKTG